MRAALTSVALAVLLAAPVAAAAARSGAPALPAPDAATAEARALFLAAEAHYRLGRFPEALAGYERAYERKPLPGFLFNLGQCNRMMGNHERAIFFFEGYLRGVPAAPNRALVEELIAESRVALVRAADERRGADARREAERSRLEREAADRIAGDGVMRTGATTRPPGGVFGKWWFWTIVGAVIVAGAATGTVAALSGPELVLPSGTLGTADRR